MDRLVNRLLINKTGHQTILETLEFLPLVFFEIFVENALIRMFGYIYTKQTCFQHLSFSTFCSVHKIMVSDFIDVIFYIVNLCWTALLLTFTTKSARLLQWVVFCTRTFIRILFCSFVLTTNVQNILELSEPRPKQNRRPDQNLKN